MLIGVIGSPVGMLIGGASGGLVGSVFDVNDVPDVESALSDISGFVGVGRTALLAVVAEATSAVVDAAMSELDGRVVRWPLSDVEAELAAARGAERAARSAVRRELFATSARLPS